MSGYIEGKINTKQYSFKNKISNNANKIFISLQNKW